MRTGTLRTTMKAALEKNMRHIGQLISEIEGNKTATFHMDLALLEGQSADCYDFLTTQQSHALAHARYELSHLNNNRVGLGVVPTDNIQFLSLRASVRHVVGSADKFANLRGQAAAELVLFVHDFMRAGVKQFPMQNVVAAAGDNEGVRGEVADQVD